MGAIDRYVVDPKESVKDADLVFLATPVDTYERHLQEWSSCLKPGAIVTDVGSVKGELVERSEALMPAGVHFVGAHPIAGKEKTGVAAGSGDLFTGRTLHFDADPADEPAGARTGRRPCGRRRGRSCWRWIRIFTTRFSEPSVTCRTWRHSR